MPRRPGVDCLTVGSYHRRNFVSNRAYGSLTHFHGGVKRNRLTT